MTAHAAVGMVQEVITSVSHGEKDNKILSKVDHLLLNKKFEVGKSEGVGIDTDDQENRESKSRAEHSMQHAVTETHANEIGQSSRLEIWINTMLSKLSRLTVPTISCIWDLLRLLPGIHSITTFLFQLRSHFRAWSRTFIWSPNAVGTQLTVKRVDVLFDDATNKWRFQKTRLNDTANWLDARAVSCYAFTVARKLSDPDSDGSRSVTSTTIDISSVSLVNVVRHVLRDVTYLSSVTPLNLDSKLLIAFLPSLKKHLEELRGYLVNGGNPTGIDDLHTTIKHLAFLLDFIETEHRETIDEINTLITRGRITFPLLYAFYIPGTLLIWPNRNDAETTVSRLRKIELKTSNEGRQSWNLHCYSVVPSDRQGEPRFGLSYRIVEIAIWSGEDPIEAIYPFPLSWHPDEAAFRSRLIARGKKWVSLQGMHHRFYDQLAYRNTDDSKYDNWTRSRIIVDRTLYNKKSPCPYLVSASETLDGARLEVASKSKSLRHAIQILECEKTEENVTEKEPNVVHASGVHEDTDQAAISGEAEPEPNTHEIAMFATLPHRNTKDSLESGDTNPELTDDELLMTPATVHGYCLGTERWLEFQVEHIQEIEWADNAFSDLIMPRSQKTLIQSLVRSHSRANISSGNLPEIDGKGHALLFNFYGPTGVGKTLTAKAVTEYARKPFYNADVEDLVVTPSNLQSKLLFLFDLASAWDAVLVFRDADTFLDDSSRLNTFLRLLDSFRGIAILTTNELHKFSEKLRLRVDVSVSYHLSSDARGQIWATLLDRAGTSSDAVTPLQIKRLGERNINGRQIRNVVRAASVLAYDEGKTLDYQHLLTILNLMEHSDSRVVPCSVEQHLHSVILPMESRILLKWKQQIHALEWELEHRSAQLGNSDFS